MPSALSEQFRGELTGLTMAPPARDPRPDEVDLRGMARAGLNYLRRNPEPQRNHECKFSLGPLGIPCHVPLLPANQDALDPISLADTDCRMDWQYPHLREMVGETTPDPVEEGVRRRVLGYLRDDHLAWTNPAAWTGPEYPVKEDYASTWASAKLLFSLAETYQRTRDPQCAEAARGILLALRALAHWDGPRAFYPGGPAPVRNGEWLGKGPGWGQVHCHNYPFIVEPAVRYWECTGDVAGLELAIAFTEGFLANSQPDMGTQRIDPETGAFTAHVHIHTHTLWGVAHLGAVRQEARYLNWARKAYDFVVANGTDYGWYPEFIPQSYYRTEICVVGDMTSTAAWLARGGWPHYWDHVERTVRNELRRSQFTITPAFLRLYREVHQAKTPEAVAAALTELRRYEGGFVAQAAFDDWVAFPGSFGQPGMYANGIQMMGCCPPEGMRGLWEAWNGVVEERPEGVFVNLALSRSHPAAAVTACRPADGRLEVVARQAGTFFLRPPAWAARDTVSLRHGGSPTPLAWGGPANAYVVCPDVKPEERLVLTWDVPHFTQRFHPQSIPGQETTLTVHWVGNEVVGVEPRGQYLPMFPPAE